MPDDRDDARPLPTHQIGQPLDTVSVEELLERLDQLRVEIKRIEVSIASKRAARDQASSLFKT